jgi:outer membrane protein assembly factor BamB
MSAVTTMLCAFVFCGAVLCSFVVGSFGADETGDNPQGSTPIEKHGPAQILAENLLRVREQELLLQSIRIGADGRFTSESLEALQQIFAYPTDVFRIDPKTAEPSGIRQQALRRLVTADQSAQMQWMQSMTVLADSDFRKAIESGNRSALSDVARAFPLTESGTRAAILTLTADFLSGRSRDVEQRLRQLLADYEGTIHEESVRNMSKSLLEKMGIEPADSAGVISNQHEASAVSATRLSLSTAEDAGIISPPWPKAVWTWAEDVWSFPGLPQPHAGNALESMIPGSGQSLSDFRNWRPVLWDDSLILRTPFRIVAFEKSTGRKKWTMSTQTFNSEENVNNSHEDDADNLRFSGGSGDEPGIFNGLAAFGLMSSDDEFLYLIDRFNFFSSAPDLAESGFRPRGRLRLGGPEIDPAALAEAPQATRIVALRKSRPDDVPQVAWIAGDRQNFQYLPIQPTPPGNKYLFGSSSKSLASSLSNAATNKATEPQELQSQPPISQPAVEQPAASAGASSVSREDALTLNGHRFQSPPVGLGELLFVPSTFRDVQWLSCLRRGTGDILWQQPLTFSDDLMSRYEDGANPVRTTSVCLLVGESVICSLPSGIMIAARAFDGQLLWATAIRDGESTPQMRGFRWQQDFDEDSQIESPCVLLPMAGDGVIVCTDTRSAKLHGIDAETGGILWSSSRRAFGSGDTGGSPDHYVAGIANGQAIMVGERHCRSINLRTGNQNWVVPITRTSGRAECRGRRCLIPQADGQVVTVNTDDGTIVRQRPSFLPSDASLQFGAITSDDQYVYVSTPVSLAVFPRSDVVSRTIPLPDPITPESSAQVLTRIQALLINGDDQLAIETLKSAASVTTSGSDNSADADNEELREPFERHLGELILQDWADRIVQSMASAEDSNLQPLISPERAELLPRLNLTSEQQVRAAVLAVLNHPENSLTENDFQELAEFPEWRKVITITDGWSVRPDLLLEKSGTPPVIDIGNTASLSIPKRRQIAANVTLFPNQINSDQRRNELIEQLIRTGDFSSAETVAISWQNISSSPLPRKILSELRQRDVIAGLGDDSSHAASESSGSTEQGVNTNIFPGLTTANARDVTFESAQNLCVTDWNMQRVERGFWISNLPTWIQPKFFLVDGPGNMPELVSIDMHDGSLRDRVPLPFAFHRNTIGYRALWNGATTPGLVPFAGAEHITMVSCIVPDKATVVWNRKLAKSEADNSVIEFGPLGADHFVWHHRDELHCSHPLTGQDLWVRRLRLSPVTRPIRGVQRIFGDHNTTVVMGTDLSSYERFSTRDGKSLGSGRLSIGRISDAVTVGRCLLYPDSNSHLHLFDGGTGLDALQNGEPIILGRHNPDSMFHVLNNGQVVTVTSDFDIVLIDTMAGKVVFRTPVASHVKTGSVFGLTAFERHGQLFVGLEEQREFISRSLEGSFRLRDPRMHGGPLLCLDPKTGAVKWTMPLQETSMPEIHGAPTDVMLMWSQPPVDELQPNEKRNLTLKLQLVDVATGNILAAEPSMASSRPLRCVHHADRKQIDLIARDAIITIKAEPRD